MRKVRFVTNGFWRIFDKEDNYLGDIVKNRNEWILTIGGRSYRYSSFRDARNYGYIY